MIRVYHGELIEVSRKELNQLREQFVGEKIILDGKTISLTDLVQAVESNTLFGSARLVIVENLFSKRLTLKSAELPQFIELITRLPKETELVFWEEKELPKTLLAKFPKHTDIAIFRPDRLVFSFVEALQPQKSQYLLQLFDKTVRKESVELLFAMLVRQLRYLIMVKDSGKEIKELSPWQISKFMRQAEYFQMSQLLLLYKQLLEIDVKIKSGTSPFSLQEEIKIMLAKL